MMENLLQDLRFALRVLRKSPGFTLPAVIALALGIGANAAIFSMVSAVLLRPLPYREPARLVTVTDSFLGLSLSDLPASVPEYADFQRYGHAFEGWAAYADNNVNLTGLDQPLRVQLTQATASLFPLLGISAERGRTFLPEEDEEGRSQVVLLSHRFWKHHLNGAADVLGRTLTLDGVPFTVVGVMPASFDFPARSELWTPFGFTAAQKGEDRRHFRFLQVLARVKPGYSLEQARADLEKVAQDIQNGSGAYGASDRWTLALQSLTDRTVGQMRTALWVLLVAVGFVLLIACGNVANLLLARAAAREREMALRGALGADRRRLIAQLLTESTLLALVGGGTGLLLAVLGVDLLVATAPEGLPRAAEIQVNWGVAAVTLFISTATGLLFGLAPALHSSRVDVHKAMSEGARDTGSRAGRVRSALVVAQVALALVLLLGAGLMLRSFRALSQLNPGFEPRGALTASIALPQEKYSEDARVVGFYEELLRRAASLPGVSAAGATTILPLTVQTDNSFQIEGKATPADASAPNAQFRMVTPGYFRAMGTPLVAGRDVSDKDRAEAPLVVVVNQSLARRYWAGEDPLGKRIRLFGLRRNGAPWPWATVVGVAADVRELGLEQDARPTMYVNALQAAPQQLTLVVRTMGAPLSLANGLRRELSALDSELPLYNVETLEAVVERTVGQRRFATDLLALFAAVALILSAVGIYGMASYSVTQRTRELSIRIALGANQLTVMRLVLGQALRLAVWGVGLGLVAGFVLTRLIASLLFGVGAGDPVTLLGISLLMGLVVLLASAVPTWRATRIEPMVALRGE